MGAFKKEKSRRIREDAKGDGTHVKGENFYRDAAKVRKLNMYKDGKPRRNAQGQITQAATMQSKEAPIARVEPNRRWFGNTRVIAQDVLTSFRQAVQEKANDPYHVLLRQNKLPMSLLNENTKPAKQQVTETEPFSDTFGPKSRRKRPKILEDSVETLAESTKERHDVFELAQTNKGEADEFADSARDPIFSKGQSKRIWGELYKVIDSSDVVVHVLDARDPLGTRCRTVENYIKKEAPHKHLIFVLNKCDLIPNWAAVSFILFSNFLKPWLSQGSIVKMNGSLLRLWKRTSVHAQRPF